MNNCTKISALLQFPSGLCVVRRQSDEERFAITVARPINHRGQDNAVVIAVVQL